jgi:hypothetical protein
MAEWSGGVTECWSNGGVLQWWSNGVLECWLSAIFHYAQVYLSIRGLGCFWIRMREREALGVSRQRTGSRISFI